MQTTANYGLKKPEGNDTVDIDVINGNMDTIDGELEKRMLSNEFSVSGTPLTTEKSNIIGMVNELFTSADNGKTSIYNAIVGKGTTPASKQFIDLAAGINAIARGQGNAVESQVRAGVKFSNADGTLRTGTLPVQATTAQTVTPGTSDQVKAAGIYDNAITVKGDSNLASANIKSGTTIFGVSGKSSVVDTADATAITADKILSGYSAYVNGSKVNGTLNASSFSKTIQGADPLRIGTNKASISNGDYYIFDGTSEANKVLRKKFNNSGTLLETTVIKTGTWNAGNIKVVSYIKNRLFISPNSVTYMTPGIYDWNGTLISAWKNEAFYVVGIFEDGTYLSRPGDSQTTVWVYNAAGTLLTSIANATEMSGNMWQYDFKVLDNNTLMFVVGGSNFYCAFHEPSQNVINTYTNPLSILQYFL